MLHAEWLRSHVERCLQDVWNVCQVISDPDGDYTFRSRTSACYVSVIEEEPFFVRVWAIAARGPKRSLALLSELNEINSRTCTALVYWTPGAVIVEQTLSNSAVSRASLDQACTAVSAVADDIGALVAAVYGGTTPFSPEDETADDSEGAA